MFDLSFYKGKKVLITGHTGFKGSWMCRALLLAGAEVTGYSLEPPTEPALFDIAGLSDDSGVVKVGEGTLRTVIGDICDFGALKLVFDAVQPEIVIHMAAQPIVRESYRDPVGTYETNVMGTVNLLECVRLQESVVSVVNVTTDKVYLNREWSWGYRENEELNGYDPYSNSKSCSELVTSSYKNSFFGGERGVRASGKRIAITTMRAGNVIGGGDFASDRIIPDCIRAVEKGEEIIVRNPYSTRPYQHVLEPVMSYLMVAAKQYENPDLAGCYNVGPDEEGCYTTGNLVDLFCRCWNESEFSKMDFEKAEDTVDATVMSQKRKGYQATWKNVAEANAPHEANFLRLDCTKLKNTFGWHPVWKLETAMEKIVEWTELFLKKDCGNDDVTSCMDRQIEEYCGKIEHE